MEAIEVIEVIESIEEKEEKLEKQKVDSPIEKEQKQDLGILETEADAQMPPPDLEPQTAKGSTRASAAPEYMNEKHGFKIRGPKMFKRDKTKKKMFDIGEALEKAAKKNQFKINFND